MIKELLVIIDPQNDFIHPEGAYAKRHRIKQISLAMERINSVMENWNKDHIVIIYSNYKTGQFGENLPLAVPGSMGHLINEDLHFHKGSVFISKNQHSAFSSDSFRSFLQKQKVKVLFLCGFLAEYCVRETALDALKNHYKVRLIEDCIGTGDDVQCRKANLMKELKTKGAEIIRGEEIPEVFNKKQ